MRAVERSRKGRSSPSGSGRYATRSSAVIRSQSFHPPAMVWTSLPIARSVVRGRKTEICVKRQKRSRWPAAPRARVSLFPSGCGSFHIKAIHTFTSGKFNVFINLFVGQVHLWAVGAKKRKPDATGPSPLFFQEDGSCSCQHQLADRTAASGGLLLELAVQGGGDIDRGADRSLLHGSDYRHMP